MGLVEHFTLQKYPIKGVGNFRYLIKMVEQKNGMSLFVLCNKLFSNIILLIPIEPKMRQSITSFALSLRLRFELLSSEMGM